MACLTIDRADIDDPAPAPLAHSREAGFRHVEAATQIDTHDLVPIIIAHLVKCAVAGDAGIVHDHIDRSYLGGHPGAALQARLMVAHVPFVRLDTGVGLELFGGGIVARVIGDDGEACVLQLLTDSAANASCSASNDCNACHSRISKYNSSIRGSDAVASWE